MDNRHGALALKIDEENEHEEELGGGAPKRWKKKRWDVAESVGANTTSHRTSSRVWAPPRCSPARRSQTIAKRHRAGAQPHSPLAAPFPAPDDRGAPRRMGVV